MTPQAQSFAVKPSQLLKRSLVSLHLLALMACWLSAVTVLLKALITLLIGFNLHKIMRAKTTHAQSCYLQYTVALGWQIAEQVPDYQMINLLPSTVVTRLLTVIHYQTSKHSWKSLVVMRDSLAPESYRQLIVQLKVAKIAIDP